MFLYYKFGTFIDDLVICIFIFNQQAEVRTKQLALFVVLQTFFGVLLTDDASANIVLVPAGNREEQPSRKTDWKKYEQALEQMADEKYGCVIKQAASTYNIDPVAVMGSIIGEHTYNFDLWDVGQNALLSVFMSLRDPVQLKYKDIVLKELLLENAYIGCRETRETSDDNHSKMWDCYNQVWKGEGTRNEEGLSLQEAFFNLEGFGFLGYTYGYAQLSPVSVLMVTDIVHEKTGFGILTVDEPLKIYDAILNPKLAIHYVAAINRQAVEIYKDVALVDISENPGIIATLYNTGSVKARAKKRFQKSIEIEEIYPRENYFGWLVNEKEAEIRKFYEEKIAPLSKNDCWEYVYTLEN